MNNKHSFICSQCDVITKSDSEMKKHIEEKHTHKCNLCGTTFVIKAELEDHIKAQHKTSFTCDFCTYVGAIMENHILDNHMQPDENKGYGCDE